MDTLTIIAAILALAATGGLAWVGGYELGMAAGTDKERDLANRRIAGLLAQENKRKPRTARKRRASK